VEFAGYLSGDALSSVVKNSAFVICPSEWYENLPRAVMESLAYGKPVIGANIGGIVVLLSVFEGLKGKSAHGLSKANRDPGH